MTTKNKNNKIFTHLYTINATRNTLQKYHKIKLNKLESIPICYCIKYYFNLITVKWGNAPTLFFSLSVYDSS